jgi:hypothetical protein
MMDQLTLSYVWKQKQIPVVLRRTGRGERIRVRLPFADDNRHWLQNGRRTAPEWIGGTEAYWELPKSWFNDLGDRALVRYGKISFSSTASRRSAGEHARKRSVMSANVHAWGANHGAGNDGSWFEVSDTFSTRWGDRELACRLLTAR